MPYLLHDKPLVYDVYTHRDRGSGGGLGANLIFISSV